MFDNNFPCAAADAATDAAVATCPGVNIGGSGSGGGTGGGGGNADIYITHNKFIFPLIPTLFSLVNST